MADLGNSGCDLGSMRWFDVREIHEQPWFSQKLRDEVTDACKFIFDTTLVPAYRVRPRHGDRRGGNGSGDRPLLRCWWAVVLAAAKLFSFHRELRRSLNDYAVR